MKISSLKHRFELIQLEVFNFCCAVTALKNSFQFWVFKSYDSCKMLWMLSCVSRKNEVNNENPRDYIWLNLPNRKEKFK